MIDFNSKYGELLFPTADVIVKAGIEVMKIYGSKDFEVTLKEDKSPLTIADRTSHSILVAALTKTGFPVLSEESELISWSERKKWQRFWLVDPLDGTKEFIKRNDQFTVNIALIDHEKPVMGLIYLPVTGKLYFALEGAGSYRLKIPESGGFESGQLRALSTRLPVVEDHPATRVIASRSHLNEETGKWIKGLEKTGPVEVLSFGSSLKLCVIAEGGAEIYPRLGPTMEWDIAAGHIIVTESGGKMMRIDGNPLAYNKEDLHNPWFIAHSWAFRENPTIEVE